MTAEEERKKDEKTIAAATDAWMQAAIKKRELSDAAGFIPTPEKIKLQFDELLDKGEIGQREYDTGVKYLIHHLGLVVEEVDDDDIPF